MPIPEGFQNYAASLGFSDSKTLGRILEILFDGEDDAIVTKAMPGSVPEISERCGLSETRVQEVVDKLFSRGALHRTMKRADYFLLIPSIIEFRDSTVIYWEDMPQELFELWHKLMSKEISPETSIIKDNKKTPLARFIPIEETIKSENMILDIDSARKIFSEAELISAIPCACRTVLKKNDGGENCPAPEKALCMSTNGFARVALERGVGEQLTNTEALKRIDEAEKAGLVHVVRNNVKEDMFMCNCCSCCCAGIHFIRELGYQANAPSRFRAEVDVDNCNACGTCEEMCMFNAIVVDSEASIIEDKCYGCGLCVVNCPEEAMSLKEVRPKEFVRVS